MTLRAQKTAPGGTLPENQFLVQIPRESPRKLAIDAPVNWSEVFGNEAPLRAEIGFGKSEFLIDVAEREPDFNYIGFEYSTKRVGAFLRKLGRRGIDNVRVLNVNALHVLPQVFGPGSLKRIYVLFPDPWPKKRHAKHRLVQDKNIELFSSLLEDGGGLSLRTDAPHYASQMLETVDASRMFRNLSGGGQFALRPRDAIQTLYQVKFVRAGRSIFYLEYEKSDERRENGQPSPT